MLSVHQLIKPTSCNFSYYYMYPPLSEILDLPLNDRQIQRSEVLLGIKFESNGIILKHLNNVGKALIYATEKNFF